MTETIKNIIYFFIEYFSIFLDSLLGLTYYFVYIPLFFLVFGFFETFPFTWYIIPMEIISIWTVAVIQDKLHLVIVWGVTLFVGVFLGMLMGYWLWNCFFRIILYKLESNYPTIRNYLQLIDDKLEKHSSYYSFPILINIGFLRPLLSVHLGARKYNLKSYLIWSLIWSFFYALPRVVLGMLLGIFGSVIAQYASVGYQYILFALVVIIILGFIVDIKRTKNTFKRSLPMKKS